MFRRSIPLVALAIMLFSVAGCTSTIIMHDPKTGATAQCLPDTGNDFGFMRQRVADSCAEGYEKLGWQRVN